MENTNPPMPPPPTGNPNFQQQNPNYQQQQNPNYQQQGYQQNYQQMPPGGYQQQFGGFAGQIDHPKASTINTLGILGLILTFLVGIVGLVLNIVNLAISGSTLSEINANPGRYSEASIRKIKTGRTCSIVGLCIHGAVILIVILAVLATM
jgi:hypothetical protein